MIDANSVMTWKDFVDEVDKMIKNNIDNNMKKDNDIPEMTWEELIEKANLLGFRVSRALGIEAMDIDITPKEVYEQLLSIKKSYDAFYKITGVKILA
jgi:CheY-specific phosphatase CheX